MDFITSDLHFNHINMTQEGSAFVSRRAHFETVEEMNEYIIKAHNRVVRPQDTVYILGDVAMTHGKDSVNKTIEYLKRMNGSLVIIKGNHDSSSFLSKLMKANYMTKYGPKFTIEELGLRIKRNKMILHLTHYPLQTGGRGNLYSVHGHLHEYESPFDYGINVCIDSPEIPDEIPFGQPLELDLVCELLKAKQDTDVSSNAY